MDGMRQILAVIRLVFKPGDVVLSTHFLNSGMMLKSYPSKYYAPVIIAFVICSQLRASVEKLILLCVGITMTTRKTETYVDR
jgi:hypothetical protein